MSEGLNKVMLLGNLGSDPELKVTQGGTAILKLSLATTESFVDKNNKRQDKTEWHRVQVWGKRAEGLAKILKKGDRIFVEGKIETSVYDKKGEKVYSTSINATNVLLAGGGAKSNGEPQSRQPSASPSKRAPAQAVEEPSFEDFGETSDEIPF